uniref:TTF-type domain-containing protein n=1 Tax=Brassica oleracea var. oleracea TaxID=109376 RepID=A0A0D3BLP4_BRAOL
MDKFLNLKRKSPSTDDIHLDDMPHDPGERKRIHEYDHNQIDEVRRKYLTRGPCQLRGHSFKQRVISGALRRFNPSWFDQYGDWLEYSVKKEKAYCFFCYLFSNEKKSGSVGFVTEGFDSWNKSDRLAGHVGAVNSFHNIAKKKCEDLMRQVDAARYLLKQGLPFRAHDETVDSSSKGNFLELVKYTAAQNEDVSKVVLKNAPGNNQMVSHPIQKDIVNCFLEEVINSIVQEMDNDVFALLVDESADCSMKEQMAIVFRFVDKHGMVKERFVGLIHVKDTCSLSLKSGIDSLLAKYSLSLKKVRGQGYNGAGNMRGEFNGLRALISKENSSAYYVHCFAHQLQLVVVAVAKKHFEVRDFFDKISLLVNVVAASCKRKDKMREIQRDIIEKGISNGEIKTGKGLNQESSLPRPGITRWGYQYKTLLRLIEMFSSVDEMLMYVEDEGADLTQRSQANGLLKYIHTFDSFCKKHDTGILNMEDDFIDPRKPRKKTNITNLHHYQFNFFYTVLDMELQEFNGRFNEVNSELLVCTSALSPTGSFREFDKEKLLRLAKFYPEDFSVMECISLKQQLDIYIDNVRRDERFTDLKHLGDLSRLMVETKKNLSQPLVYRLLKLSLTLPVATATVERCFSGMKIVKTVLRNRIGDQFLSDCCFIEKKIFEDVANETVIKRFQAMSERRVHL